MSEVIEFGVLGSSEAFVGKGKLEFAGRSMCWGLSVTGTLDAGTLSSPVGGDKHSSVEQRDAVRVARSVLGCVCDAGRWDDRLRGFYEQERGS